MKHLFTLAILVSSAQLFAQSTILSLSVSPANPTVNDVVTVYAECQFPSGDCVPDYAGHNVNGFTISATGHHCLGPLAFICSYTDTFEIGLLPQGDYTFDFTLTTGFGGPGCTAGILPDDNDQLQFTVSPSVGIEEISVDSDFAFPNPTIGKVFFKKSIEELSVLTDIQGKVIMQIGVGTNEINLAQVPSGIYFLTSETKRLKIVKN